jgi:hypothetical protein
MKRYHSTLSPSVTPRLSTRPSPSVTPRLSPRPSPSVSRSKRTSARKTRRRSPGRVIMTNSNMYPKVHTNPIVVRGSVRPYYFDMEHDNKRAKNDSRDSQDSQDTQPLNPDLYDPDGTQPLEQELDSKNRGGFRKRLCKF